MIGCVGMDSSDDPQLNDGKQLVQPRLKQESCLAHLGVGPGSQNAHQEESHKRSPDGGGYEGDDVVDGAELARQETHPDGYHSCETCWSTRGRGW